jgi:acetyl esterase/lipase
VTTLLLCVVLAGVSLATACVSPASSVDDAANAGTASAPATAVVTAGTAPRTCAEQGTFRYATPPGVDPSLTSLDVYQPTAQQAGCGDRPLVVWIHGGGWTGGDKTEYMPDKVRLFTDAGDVFASINYRLTDKTAVPPAPRWPVHDQDAADAIAWLVAHAGALGVDPTRIAVIGHSAGGGITSAVATDARYLGASSLPLTTIRCAGSLDGEGYDITAGATTADPAVQQGYRNAFGTDPAAWQAASPIVHVAPGKGIPSFFVAARGDAWRLGQHQAFIAALRAAAVPTTVLDASSLQHADLSVDLGAPDDTVLTPAVMSFLSGCLGSAA